MLELGSSFVDIMMKMTMECIIQMVEANVGEKDWGKVGSRDNMQLHTVP